MTNIDKLELLKEYAETKNKLNKLEIEMENMDTYSRMLVQEERSNLGASLALIQARIDRYELLKG